jgi:hypothetical protein
VIGLLLILSILLPNMGSRLRARAPVVRGALLKGGGALAAVALFALFFFWSRALILTP